MFLTGIILINNLKNYLRNLLTFKDNWWSNWNIDININSYTGFVFFLECWLLSYPQKPPKSILEFKCSLSYENPISLLIIVTFDEGIHNSVSLSVVFVRSVLIFRFVRLSFFSLASSNLTIFHLFLHLLGLTCTHTEANSLIV